MAAIIEIPGKGKFIKKLRVYQVSLVRSAAVGANFVGTIQLEPSEVPFLMTSLQAADTGDGAALTSQEPWLVAISDNASNYLWNDGLVERTTMFGGREFGNQLSEEIPIPGNTRVSITVQNRAAGAVAGTAIVTLRGWQLAPVK